MMMQYITGYWVSQAIYTLTKLGVPEELKNGPASAETLAESLSANPDFLYRLLRASSAMGLLEAHDNRQFSLSPLGQLLRDNVPNSMRAIVLMMGEEHLTAWNRLLDGVQTGQTPFEMEFGTQCFDYLEKNQRAGDLFNAAMTSFVENEVSQVTAAYDFGQFEQLVDVGGGHGRLLASILKQNPQLSGVVFDLPHVVNGAAAIFEQEGVSDRAKAEGGDFFQSVPANADGYIMSHIIHDWSDSKSLEILKNIRQVIRPNGKLLLAETVILPGPNAINSTLMDLNMLVMTPGGRERTRAEYEALLSQAGFSLVRIIPVSTMVSIIEAVPAAL